MPPIDERTTKLQLASILLLRRRRRMREQKTQKRLWIHPWLARRAEQGAYENLMQELEEEDTSAYVSFQRVHPELFKELVDKVRPLIQKQNTVFRAAIPAELRLAITLRYLATGNSFMSHKFSFRVGDNTIGKIVPETCEALYKVLQPDYMQFPSTTDEWLQIEEDFHKKWNLPHCLGAIDGKHVLLRQPPNSGSIFYNYKHSFSIVLMAVADARYRFTYIDIGKQGRVSDGGVFGATTLSKALLENTLNFPEPIELPGGSTPIPYYLVGDDAFPMRSYLMKPFPFRNMSVQQRIYNYRLSRARRVIENAFGIMANRFRVLLTPILIGPEKATKVVKACCVLHNLLITRYPKDNTGLGDTEDFNTHEILPGSWREEGTMPHIRAMRGNNATTAAKAQRSFIAAYLTSGAGSVHWQENMI